MRWGKDGVAFLMQVATMNGVNIPAEVPVPVRILLSALPLSPLGFLLQRLAENIGRRHPGLFSRLGEHAGKTFLVDPTDLPFVFRIAPRPDRPHAEPRRRQDTGPWDARIAGSLAALLGLVHGTADGDALFFSRDLTIEGDTEAVLALRNALDDAELDLLAEAATAFGSAGNGLGHAARHLAPMASRLSGLALTRGDRR